MHSLPNLFIYLFIDPAFFVFDMVVFILYFINGILIVLLCTFYLYLYAWSSCCYCYVIVFCQCCLCVCVYAAHSFYLQPNLPLGTNKVTFTFTSISADPHSLEFTSMIGRESSNRPTFQQLVIFDGVPVSHCDSWTEKAQPELRPRLQDVLISLASCRQAHIDIKESLYEFPYVTNSTVGECIMFFFLCFDVDRFVKFNHA